MYEVFFKYSSCLAAFSCRHIKYKIHAPECTETRRIFMLKIQKFLLPQRDGDTPSRTHPPRRLRHLDLRAFGAHSCTSQIESLAMGLLSAIFKHGAAGSPDPLASYALSWAYEHASNAYRRTLYDKPRPIGIGLQTVNV